VVAADSSGLGPLRKGDERVQLHSVGFLLVKKKRALYAGHGSSTHLGRGHPVRGGKFTGWERQGVENSANRGGPESSTGGEGGEGRNAERRQ